MTATGGIQAAGIGGGDEGRGSETITISGGKVEANGVNFAAGIGGGYKGSDGGNHNYIGRRSNSKWRV